MFIYRNLRSFSGRKLSTRRPPKVKASGFLWMRKQSARMLEFEIGNPAIITDQWDYLVESSRNCFNAPGFREVTEQAGRWLSPTRRLSGSPRFPFHANLSLVDIP